MVNDEGEVIDTLSAWNKSVRSLIQIKIKQIMHLRNIHLQKYISYLHNTHIVIPADKPLTI